MDLVVLGHRLNIDGKIRPILRRRLDHASQLYLPLHAGRIILVGGNPVGNDTRFLFAFGTLSCTHLEGISWSASAS
jgi:hypothetical protein